MRMDVGSLQETLSVSASDPAPAPPARPAPRAFTSGPCQAATFVANGIGGNILAPTKLVHVAPQYPASLAPAKQAGVVVLEARIAEDGTIREVRTVSTPNTEFELAAVDAVRQWEFSQTLLNCKPVEVMMTVTVRFSAD
jgi:TonB family protein